MPKFLSDGLFSGTSTDLEVGGTLDVTGKITTASHIELAQYGYIDFGTDSNNRLQLFNSLSGATLKQWGAGDLHIYSVSNNIDFTAGVSGLGTNHGLKVVGESIQTPIVYELGDTSVYLDLGNTTTSLKTAGPIITKGVNQFKSVGGAGSSVAIELKGNSSGSNSDYLAKSTIKTMYDTATPSGGTANNNSMMQFRVGKGTDAFQHTVLTLDSSLDATFAGSVIANGTTLTGDQDLSGYYTEAEANAKFTSTDSTGDNYTFEIEDASSFSGNKWYHVATIGSGNGGLHIRGAILNHVENFASQKLDLAIQVREANDGGQLEIAGTVDVFHNESATNSTDKCGVRVIKSAENGTYDDFKVYVRITRFQMLTLRLTQQGLTSFNTNHSSPLTSEPAPVSGGHVEIDTSTLLEGHHTIVDSAVKLTVAKDSATFAGNVQAPYITANNPSGGGNGSAQEVARFVNMGTGATSSYMYIGASSGTDWRLGKNIMGTTSNTNFGIAKHSGTILALEIDGSNNATFAGTISSGTHTIGNSGTSRFTDTSAFPLQLNRGLAVDVHGTNGVVLGLGSYSTGTTYVDAARIAANLESATSGDLFLQVNNSGTYTNALTINNDTNATFAGSVSIQSDNDNRFLVRSNDYTISRIISRGNTGTNLDKGLFSLMSSDGTNNNVEKVRIDTAGLSWFDGGNMRIGGDLDVTGNYTGHNITLTGNINTKSISGANAGNAAYLGHPESSQLWTGINASGSTAKRYHIARLYGAPAHWDSNWQNIEILATCEYYESASLEYCLIGDYGGAGTQANMIKLYLKEKSGGVNSRFRISLGTPVDAGWDYSNADVFYVDVYADAAYYTQWKVSFKCFGHPLSSAAPTSGGAYTQIFTSPTASTISDFSEAHAYKFFGAKKLGLDDNDISSLAFSGTTTKTLTLTQNDGSTITGTFADTGGTSGITQSDADTRYVNATGDVMTGNLTLNTGSQLILDTAAGNERGYIQATDTNDAHLIIATSGGEDIAFKDGGLSGTTNFLIRGNGDALTSINHYARAYYDSVSTGYFLDPGGNSSSVAATLRGRVVVYDEQSVGGNLSLRNLNRRFYGGNHYEPGQTVLTAEHTSDYVVGNGRAVTALVLGNTPFGAASASSGKDIFNITRVNQAAYGPSSGQGFFRKLLNLRGNGDLYLGNTSTVGAVYATKYYDKASTSYYLHPSSNTSLKTVGSWRANNSTWDGEYAGKMQYHGNSWYIQTQNGVFIRNASGSNMVTMTTAGVCTANNDWRAPYFYDSADTSYYLNPNGTGTSLKVAGKIEHQGITPTTGTNIDQIKEFSTSLQLTADTWTDTGINSTDLATGTYAVQVFVDDYGVGGNHYSEIYSGMMSWYDNNPNESSFTVDEITLHRAGHAPNAGHIQLRTERVASADPNDLMLQVKHNLTYSAALDNSGGKAMRFKFRRLI